MQKHVIPKEFCILTNSGFQPVLSLKSGSILGITDGLNRFMPIKLGNTVSYRPKYQITHENISVLLNGSHKILCQTKDGYHGLVIPDRTQTATVVSTFFECHSDFVSADRAFFQALGFIIFGNFVTEDEMGLTCSLLLDKAENDFKIISKLLDMAGISYVAVSSPVLGSNKITAKEIRIPSTILKTKIQPFLSGIEVSSQLYKLRDQAFWGFLSGAILANGYIVRKLAGDTKTASYEQKYNSLLNFNTLKDLIVVIQNNKIEYLEFLQALCVLNGLKAIIKKRQGGKAELVISQDDTIKCGVKENLNAQSVEAFEIYSELELVCVKKGNLIFMLGGGACQE